MEAFTKSVSYIGSDVARDPYWWGGLLLEFFSSLCGTLGKQSWRLAAVAVPASSMWQAVTQRRVALLLYTVGLVLTVAEPPLDATALSQC